MTTVDDLDVRPRLRSDVVIGPPQRKGASVVHHVKHPLTGWYYRIGPREHFLLSRMDGSRSLDELGAEYAEAFGRRLGPESWQQLFGMLYQRQLLEAGTDDALLARLTKAAADQAQETKRGPFQTRFPLFDPSRLFDRVGPRLSMLFTRGFVIPALLVVVALAGYVVYDWSRLADAVFTGDGRAFWLIGMGILIAWGIIFLHECAHGLTCWHFGGKVKEIGLLWRFPLLAPYCKVDDVVLLPRGPRVATAFAGVFVTLLALVPFAGIWLLAPEGHPAGRLAASVLLFGTVAAVVNLVPFLQLDGYYMLTHALNLTDLRRETYHFYGALLRRGPKSVAGYPRRDRIAYTVYGLATVVFVLALVTLLVRLWYVSLAAWLTPTWAVVILLGEAILLALLVAFLVRRRSRKRANSTLSTH